MSGAGGGEQEPCRKVLARERGARDAWKKASSKLGEGGRVPKGAPAPSLSPAPSGSLHLKSQAVVFFTS